MKNNLRQEIVKIIEGKSSRYDMDKITSELLALFKKEMKRIIGEDEGFISKPIKKGKHVDYGGTVNFVGWIGKFKKIIFYDINPEQEKRNNLRQEQRQKLASLAESRRAEKLK